MAFLKKNKNKNLILEIGFWYHWLSLEWCSFALLNILSRVYAYMCIVNYEHWGFFFKYFLTLCKVKWQNAWVSLEFIIIFFWSGGFDLMVPVGSIKPSQYGMQSTEFKLWTCMVAVRYLRSLMMMCFLFFLIESVALWICDKLWSFSP